MRIHSTPGLNGLQGGMVCFFVKNTLSLGYDTVIGPKGRRRGGLPRGYDSDDYGTPVD